MDWSQKPSIASYFLRTGMGSVPLTGYNMSPEIRDGVKLRTDVGVSSLQNLVQLYSKISEDYRQKSNPKKAVATLRRALTEVDLRAADAPEPVENQKKGVHAAEDAILGKAKMQMQLCATLSREGQHLDALDATQKGLDEIEQLWKHICKSSQIRVEEIKLVDLFSNPLNVEAMLRSYKLNWLEQAVCVTVQIKHCAAIELEFENDNMMHDDERAAAWEKIISLHEEGFNLAKEVLLPNHATLRLAENTLSKAKERRDAAVSGGSGAVDDPFCMQEGDHAGLDTVNEGGLAAQAEIEELQAFNPRNKKKEAAGSPGAAKAKRRRPIRRSPRIMIPNRSSSSDKNPFQDFFDDELTLDTMRKQILVRNENSVREFHLELKRRQARFREWMESSDPDDLFQFRTTFSEAGLRTMRRAEKKRALSEGRQAMDEIDAESQVKTVKGIKKNLLTSNTFLCKRAGVEQEDPDAKNKGTMALAFANALRGERAPSQQGSTTVKVTMGLGAAFANLGMKKERRSRQFSKDPFAATK